MRTLGKLMAIAGFFLIVGPALLTINGFLDNSTFTVLFVIGFVLIIVSASTRAQLSQTRKQT